MSTNGLESGVKKELESEVRDLCRRQLFHDAVDRGIRGYGSEIRNLLAYTIRDLDVADDVYGQFQVDFLGGLKSFEWRSSLRTWAHKLARHAWHRHRATPHGNPKRRIPLSQAMEPEEQARTTTAPWMQTLQKDNLRRAVELFSDDDRMLFSLRLDYQMEWNDVALVMLDDESADDEAVKRESARLRKRYEELKKKLAAVLDP